MNVVIWRKSISNLYVWCTTTCKENSWTIFMWWVLSFYCCWYSTGNLFYFVIDIPLSRTKSWSVLYTQSYLYFRLEKNDAYYSNDFGGKCSLYHWFDLVPCHGVSVCKYYSNQISRKTPRADYQQLCHHIFFSWKKKDMIMQWLIGWNY